MSFRVILACVAAAILIAVAAIAQWGSPEVRRVSVASDGTQGDYQSMCPAVSEDGRYVAFGSQATNLVAGDGNSAWDVFVHDLQTGQVERVSLTDSEGEGNADSGHATMFREVSMTPDARYVCFYSNATNLVTGDGNSAGDVFVRDRTNNTTGICSVSTLGGQAVLPSLGQAISDDGNIVAFQSGGSGLVPDDTNGRGDVFVRDRSAGTTTRVSVSTGGAQGDGHSFGASVSSDGRYVAFYSYATNLVASDTNGATDIFLRDRNSNTTTLITVLSGGTQANGSSRYPSISSDGRYVAFESDATNLVADDTNNRTDIFVYDRDSSAFIRASVASDGTQADRSSMESCISADGTYVAFSSTARNLSPSHTNYYYDIFVHNTQTGGTVQVSQSTAGEYGTSDSSYWPAISAGAEVVAFHSYANNLVSDDTNLCGDLFAAIRGPLAVRWPR